MKQLRWKDFSLVSKIVIEVGMIADGFAAGYADYRHHRALSFFLP